MILLKRKLKRVPLKRQSVGDARVLGIQQIFFSLHMVFQRFGHKAQNCMNPKKQYNQKEYAPRSQRRDSKRDDIQTLESKMPHDMSLKMKSEKIHKESRETSPNKKIKKVWRPKAQGLSPHAKIDDSYRKESLEEHTRSINDDHSTVE